MATLKACVQKMRNGGFFPVYIRVTHNRTTQYIMVDNQLKHAEDTLHELEAIKGSKVDARGVEVQGILDPVGAHTMKVFKETRGWEKTDIEEASFRRSTYQARSSAILQDRCSCRC